MSRYKDYESQDVVNFVDDELTQLLDTRTYNTIMRFLRDNKISVEEFISSGKRGRLTMKDMGDVSRKKLQEALITYTEHKQESTTTTQDALFAIAEAINALAAAIRPTPVAPDRACAPAGDGETETRAAGEHDG